MGFIHKAPSKKLVGRDSVAQESVLFHLSFHDQPSIATGQLNISIIIKEFFSFSVM